MSLSHIREDGITTYDTDTDFGRDGRVDLRGLPAGELTLLRVLWSRGPSTVREVQEALGAPTTGYTTALKLLQIMLEKGLVTRDEQNRAHVYASRVSAAGTEGRLVGDLLGRAFGGSTERLVMRALGSRRASKEELSAIRKLLDELEGKAP